MMKKFLAVFLFISVSASAQPVTSLTTGTQVLSLNANAGAAPQNGTSFQSSLNTITWNVSFASAPASQTTLLQVSNDNSSWVTADTSTAVGGESRTIFTASRFVRAQLSAKSGGGAVTVSIIGRNSPVSSTALSASSNLNVNSITLAASSAPNVRIANNVYMQGRNAANNNWINMFRVSATDGIDVGAAMAAGALTSTSLTTGGITSTGGVSVAAANTYMACQATRTCLHMPVNGLFNVVRNDLTTTGFQVNVGTAVPTVATCGTGAITAGSTNSAGSFTTTGATACTLTFGAPAWTNTPFCVFSPKTTAEAYRVSAESTTAVTVTFTTSGNAFNYNCFGRVF